MMKNILLFYLVKSLENGYNHNMHSLDYVYYGYVLRGEPTLYNSIMQGIASGNERMRDIVSFMGITTYIETEGYNYRQRDLICKCLI